MTYTATRYTRAPGRMHGCPDAYRDQWGDPSHYLIPEPGQDDPAQFVCPLEWDQERAEAQRAAGAAEREAAQKERAEEIAAECMERLPFALATSGHFGIIAEVVTAAVLRGLSEAEATP